MKKIFSLVLLLFLTLKGFSQNYQRMLIPSGNISLTASGTTANSIVPAKCIDYLRAVPTSAISLHNILQNANKVIVKYNDSKLPQEEPLSNILGKDKGIHISGEKPSIFGQLFLKVTNKTGRPLDIDIQDEIVVSEIDEQLAKKYKNDNQSELWSSDIDEYKEDLDYIDFLPDLLLKDRVDHFKSQYSSIKNEIDFKEKLNEKVSEKKEIRALREQKRKERIALDKSIVDAFQATDIGIKGKTVNEYINNYSKATEKTQFKRSVIDAITSDFRNNIYYIPIKKRNGEIEYIKYLKSKRIKGLLYRYSDYVVKYHTRIENNLASKKIGLDNIEILNFLDKSEDTRTYELLNTLFPDNSSDFTLQSISKLKQRLKNKNTEYLFCYGHYEEGKIFTYVNDVKHAYSIDMINHIASELGIKVFFIGCKSSLATKGASGTTVDVNSIEMLNVLFDSLRDATNVVDFLKNLVKNSKGKHQFTFEFDENTGIIKIKINDNKRQEYYHEGTSPQIVIRYNLLNLISDTNTVISTIKDLNEHFENQDKNEN